jgi:hypothetical protein
VLHDIHISILISSNFYLPEGIINHVTASLKAQLNITRKIKLLMAMAEEREREYK